MYLPVLMSAAATFQLYLKKNNGIGFTECVTQAKIRHAKQLLLKPNAKIYEVASQLGYSDPYYFSKVFKKYTGFSPKEYMTKGTT